MARNRSKKEPPRDPEKYTWVKTRNGGHWRSRRGSKKEAQPNDSFAQNNDLSRICGKPSVWLRAKLEPFLQGLELGYFSTELMNRLKISVKKKGRMEFSAFRDFDLQPRHHLDQLLRAGYQAKEKDGTFTISIPVDDDAVKKKNSMVNHYYYEAVLVYGDPSVPGALRNENTVSALYDINSSKQEDCMLDVVLPPEGVPWMVLLKLSCLEGDELAAAGRNYGMKVVGVGG